MTTPSMTTDDWKRLEAKAAALISRLDNPGPILHVVARAAGNVLRRHFRRRPPNKKGWTSAGFWGQVADSVQEDYDAKSATIVVNDPRFLFKMRGGVLKPKRAKALAIPLAPEFYGVLPSTFPRDRFFLIKDKKGKHLGILAQKNPDGSLRLCYVLKKSTTHKPDPQALPPISEMETEVVETIEDYLADLASGAA